MSPERWRKVGELYHEILERPAEQRAAGAGPSRVPTKDLSAEVKPLTPEEQMALYEEKLKEEDWGHQPC